jgi:hypothetical protein
MLGASLLFDGSREHSSEFKSVRISSRTSHWLRCLYHKIQRPSRRQLSNAGTRWLAGTQSIPAVSEYARVVGHRHIATDFAIEIVQSTHFFLLYRSPECMLSVRLFNQILEGQYALSLRVSNGSSSGTLMLKVGKTNIL